MRRLSTLILLLLVLPATTLPAQDAPEFYFGADLSYVNEMEDHGGTFAEDGHSADPFVLFARNGLNLVRVRLWHSPDWTTYSVLEDVKKTIRRSHKAGMPVLLDFHYSDDWADPQKQTIPAAWAEASFETLTDSVYHYTGRTLRSLHKDGLLPEMVQIGNEINHGMLWPHGRNEEWRKLGDLLNSGIRAVREVSRETGRRIDIMLHVAQPEHVDHWLQNIDSTGKCTDYNLIGLSYYAKWSSVPLDSLSIYIARFKKKFRRPVIVAETAYPWTMGGASDAANILGEDSIEPGYPATAEGQLNYLIALTQAIIDGGGGGIIYWEPAWISTSAKTRWGEGSHWENATLFDLNNQLLPGIRFTRHQYRYPQ